MKIYNFTLVLSKYTQDIDNIEDLLFEVGCDDATLSFCGVMTYLEFDREGNNFTDAINIAIRQVESINKNVYVIRIEPHDLVNMSEMARRINRSTNFVSLLVYGEKGNGNFPTPISEISHKSLWSWCQVTRWLEKNNMIDQESVEIAQYIADVNYALFFRQDFSALNRVMNVQKKLSLV